MVETQPVTAEPKDLSNRTIVILVILALIVSFIGAWVNIQQAMTMKVPVQETPVDASAAKIEFTVNTPPQIKKDTSSAQVGMVIANVP